MKKTRDKDFQCNRQEDFMIEEVEDMVFDPLEILRSCNFDFI